MELKLMFNKSYPNPWQSKISSGAIIVYYLYSLIYFEIVVQALHPRSCRNMRTPVLWTVLSVGLGSSESWSNKWEKERKMKALDQLGIRFIRSCSVTADFWKTV